MKASALKYTILSAVASLIMVVLALLPFHAFLTVWLSSLVGHYTALRLWKEVVLLICSIGIGYLLLTDSKIRTHTLTRRLVQLILLYGVVTGLLGLLALDRQTVSTKALAYGMLVNLRFLAFFLICWAAGLRTARLFPKLNKLILIPAAIVVVFGLLQIFVLPNNFLVHFGYGPQTIPAYETINHNSQYIRIASTLRGANPLGAYILVPITMLVGLIISGRRRWPQLSLLAGAFIVLIFSFSRSAWIGTAISVGIVIAMRGFRSRRVRQLSLYALPIVLAAALVTTLALKDNTRFENVFLHTQQHSAVAATSNGGHLQALRSGLAEVIRQPLGRGPGTAGPASVYNNHPPRIAENYFIQIGQETGWLGLFLFLLINLGVGYLLWLRRQDPLALALFASLIGISVIGLLSHVWTDDTLAYIWWGLAGVTMAAAPKAVKPENAQ